jgi:urease alpha subunit
MSDVHLILIFLLAPFVVVLAGLIAATRIGDPECSLGTRKSSRRAMTPPMTGSHD